jgi:hypothetical protein
VIYDSFNYYNYDAEGNMLTVNSGQAATYVFNALNQRVRTVVGGRVPHPFPRFLREWVGKNVTLFLPDQ